MKVFALFLCVSLIGVFGDEKIEDVVRVLQKQITTLLNRRQEDLKLLETSLRHSLEKSLELTDLRSEVQSLRRDLSDVRGYQPSDLLRGGNREKNDHLTIQWLAGVITEIRAEVTELASSFNSSAEFQKQQSLSTDIQVLQRDVQSLRADFEHMKTSNTINAAKLSEINQEVEVAKSQSQNAASLCSDTLEKLQSSQSDWTNQSPNSIKVYKYVDSNLEVETEVRDGGDRLYRHQRDRKKNFDHLSKTLKTLQLNQMNLKRRISELETEVRSKSENLLEPDRESSELISRVGFLEMKAKTHADSLLNVTEQVSALDKVHSSMLQLLESVESLENKVDKNIPDLQREISKLEFNFAKISSSLQLITEDQDNQRVSVKAMGVGLSTMQSKQETQQSRLNALETLLSNLTNSDLPNSSNKSLSDLIGRLAQVQNEYGRIVRQFPKDCSKTNQSSGLTVLSPTSNSLLISSCKDGWTIIQRRINGSENFGRKWDEYAVGFGVASDEFWIGNDILHELTKNNDTMLRVDFTDIYGKPWRAEYTEFSVSDRKDGYRLHVAGYSGNASDALEYQNRMQFSAIDSDRDISNTNCAANYEGGWWFSYCQHANLNGRYNLGLTWFDVSRNEWIAVAQSEMSIRPRTKS